MRRAPDKIDFPPPSDFHTNAFDLGITPLQAVRNGFAFGLSLLFTLADIDKTPLVQPSEFSQDHRYIRMSARKEGERDRYRMSLQITKGAFSAPEICAAFDFPGTVTKRQALSELEAFEATCLLAQARKKEYPYMGVHYTAIRHADSGLGPLKNG